MNIIHISYFFLSLGWGINRIERLWRDVCGNVLDLFHTLFLNLELEGFLNPDNELELIVLHWIYVPQLQAFREVRNHHGLRTERRQRRRGLVSHVRKMLLIQFSYKSQMYLYLPIYLTQCAQCAICCQTLPGEPGIDISMV